MSDERGNYGTGIRNHGLDLPHFLYPSRVIAGLYERWDREVDIPGEWSRDLKHSQRVFVAETSMCWIVPVCHFC